MNYCIDFTSFRYYVNACNNRTEDAIFLILLINENFGQKAGNDWFMLSNPRVEQLSGLTSKQLKAIFPRLESRFGIEKKKMANSHGGFATGYKLDLVTLNAMFDLFCI